MRLSKLTAKIIRWIGFGLLLASGSVFAEASELVLEGDRVQGGLIKGKTLPGSVVKVDGREIRLSDEGVFLMGFGRDAPLESKVEARLPGGRTLTRTVRIAPRKYQIQRIDGLPPSKVKPPKKYWNRIAREAALAREARRLDSQRTDFLNGFIWPLQGPISGVYGSQRILNGTPRRPHFGVDIAAPVGTPAMAPADGVVTLAHPDMFYSGGTLIIDHGHGLSSTFMHLHRILVKEGQRVRQGESVAEVGATGRVTGAHLDWRMNLFTKRLDPQLLADPMPASDSEGQK